MSSEILGSAENVIKGNLGGAWDIKHGYADAYTDLGIARKFGGASAAYSLRDIGAMNGRVVKVRRDSDNAEEDFSANQIQSGGLEDWVNGKLESTLPADVATAAAAYSLRKVKADYGIPVTEVNGTDGFPATITGSEQTITGTSFTVRQFSNGSPDSSEATAVNGVYSVSATKTSTASFAKAIRIKGLEDGKQYTVKGEFRMVEDTTAGGDSQATVDISDNTAGTDEDAVSTKSTTFVPFFIDAGYNSGSDFNFVDFTVNTVGLEAGTITAEFRNVQIIENNNSVVRIRRSSDDEEVVVGFDSDNKVSASSPVTATPSGSTTATTLGDFISGTDAFVHTWYDQAGSNNAVQETAGNQPQIASNGALLDGIKFNADADGSSPDFLETDSKLGDSTDFFLSTVIGEAQGQTAFGGILTSRSAADEGFAFGLNASEKAQAFIYSSGGNTNDTSDEIFGTRKRLLSLDRDSTAINGSVNASPALSFTSNTMGSITEDKSIIGYGGRTDSISDTLGLRANINELIFYNSDQANNRFLIESNINNYYNLYNDEYEWDDATNTEWQNNVTNGTTTFTANGKDGFTITATGDNITSFKYKITSPSSASNDYYKVSFNVNDPDGLFDDAQLRLTATGAGATAQTISNGFNSMSLRTGASFEYMSINSVSGGSSKTATLSDFKISRIARNGFVETWYDQSGNSNDATQTTASDQPSIVQNGGICKSNGSPSVFFTGDTRDDELDFTDLTLTDATIFTVVNIDSSADQQIIIGGSASTSTGTMIPMMDNGSSTTQVYKNSTVGGAEQGSSQFKNGSQITLADRDDAFDNLAVDSQILFTMVDVDVAEAKVLDGISRTPSDALTFHLQGKMNELIIYNSDLSSDRGTIESEIANYYNITLL